MAYNPSFGGQYPHDQQYAQTQGQYPPTIAAPQLVQLQYQQQPNPNMSQPPSAPYPTSGPTAPHHQSSYGNVQPQFPVTDVNSKNMQHGDAGSKATAPGYDLVISGYENMGASGVGPPPSSEATDAVKPATVDANRIPAMSAEVAREALLDLIASEACWGKGAARDMKIKDVQASNAYHYALDTYTEGRITCHATAPYKGGPVDGPHNGPAPFPWQIQCSPSQMFKTEKRNIRVPHTEVVRPCHKCLGRGSNVCEQCHGRGKVKCGRCQGLGEVTVTRDGQNFLEQCSSCNGRGKNQCSPCTGSGSVTCGTCSGFGSVTQFIQLTVDFTNRHSDHVVEKTDLPDDLITNVQGDTIFEQTLPRVGPIENFFEQEINQKSRAMVNAHATSWPNERIILQRHHLRSVPVHECWFDFKEKIGRFWVYGRDKKVYTKDYPHTCCCCTCSIL